MKYFDKLQMVLTIAGISCLILAFIFQIYMTLTATPIYDAETNQLVGYQYLVVPQTLFTIFAFTHVALIAWFIARSITYKMRKKEREQENTGY